MRVTRVDREPTDHSWWIVHIQLTKMRLSPTRKSHRPQSVDRSCTTYKSRWGDKHSRIPPRAGVTPVSETVAIFTHLVWIDCLLFKALVLRQNCERLVKRRRALLESNSPRNNQPETHRYRWSGEWFADHSLSLKSPHRDDSSPHA